ncbi:unnamed protein product [Clonostachys rosea f. rosea IK726]|uniref:Uncharacterized protein n=1 Tax=Clonostachys rosea f. rosea IK726 TaxID=1349383 RepID=A0ACA9UQ79_BIOOC|nr:unnamed protein product [Clonostachys rosea f. rosea IK726]
MPSSSDIEVALPGTDVGCRENYLQMLPAELIHQIAEHVSEDLVIPTARDLLSLSLTCKRFYRPAIRLLYEFNERMTNIPCHYNWKGRFCNIHRGVHCPALKWAIEHESQWTLKAIFFFTPKVYNSSHVRYAIKCKKYNLARSMLRLQPVIDELKAGITPNSPIFAAVASGYPPLINDIIRIQGLDFQKTCPGNMSVLDYACQMGNWGLARWFLDHGANPYLRAVTSLQYAIYCSDAEASCTVVKGILTLRPNVGFISNANWAAVRHDRLDILEIFMERGIINEAFEGAPGHLGDLFKQAIQHGAIAIFRKLLSLYPTRLLTERFILDTLTEIPLQDDRGIAVQEAQLLIDHVRRITNNDLSLTFEKIKPCLSSCIWYENVMLADYILGLSGPLRVGQIPNCREWQFVCYSIEMLRILIKHGLDVNQMAARETMLQRFILDIISSKWCPWPVKYLASEVENINQYNEYKATALHTWLCWFKVSCWDEHEVLDFTAHLLDQGASLSIGNARGNTALHVAAVNTRYPSVIQLLLERGADLNARNNAGETPLQYAMRLLGSKDPSSEGQKVLQMLAGWTWVLGIPPVKKLLDKMHYVT